MESLGTAAPGVEQRAEQAAEAACYLADAIGPSGWSMAAVEDALDAIDTLTEALGGAGPELAQSLTAMAAATADARRRLGLAADERGPEQSPEAAAASAVRRLPKRRGLGPGYQGIRPAH
ncbi:MULTISPECIES: hypothetical protein [Actinomycetes]|uniref:hypothetical protein n=1 Tax=Actinomycetes TaxID=1760 RepID=UPI00342C5FCE